MKKLILGILIIGLVIGVSYIKSERQSQREESLFAEGVNSGAGQADSLKQTAESLAVLIEQQQAVFSDSLEMTKTEFDLRVDSLESLIAARDSALEAADKSASTEKAAAEPTTRERQEKSRQEKNDAIIAYYKKRYLGLPKDLSNYERRVALSEIREETAAKFSITTDQLAKLRRQYNLSY